MGCVKYSYLAVIGLWSTSLASTSAPSSQLCLWAVEAYARNHDVDADTRRIKALNLREKRLDISSSGFTTVTTAHAWQTLDHVRIDTPSALSFRIPYSFPSWRISQSHFDLHAVRST